MDCRELRAHRASRRMVRCAREGGALGARLTGAGFGGCIIALARQSEAANVLDRLEKDYFAKFDSTSIARAAGRRRASPGASTLELP